MRRIKAILLSVSFLALVASLDPAAAAVTVYTNEAQFITDAGAPVVADFNARPFGANSAFSLGGIGFAAHPPLNNLYIVDHTVPLSNTNPTPTSKCLTGNGQDDIDMTLPGGTLAVGFNTITNAYAAPVVTLTAADASVLATYTLTQGANTRGFVGFLSSTAIAKVRWLGTNGGVQNTTIDNVRVTSSPTAASTRTWGRIKQLYR